MTDPIIHHFSTKELSQLIFHLPGTKYSVYEPQHQRTVAMGKLLEWSHTLDEHGSYTWHIAEDSKLWQSHLIANKLGLRSQLLMSISDIAKLWQHLRKNEYVSYSTYWVNQVLKKHNIPMYKGKAKNTKYLIYLVDLQFLIVKPPVEDIEQAK